MKAPNSEPQIHFDIHEASYPKFISERPKFRAKIVIFRKLAVRKLAVVVNRRLSSTSPSPSGLRVRHLWLWLSRHLLELSASSVPRVTVFTCSQPVSPLLNEVSHCPHSTTCLSGTTPLTSLLGLWTVLDYRFNFSSFWVSWCQLIDCVDEFDYLFLWQYFWLENILWVVTKHCKNWYPSKGREGVLNGFDIGFRDPIPHINVLNNGFRRWMMFCGRNNIQIEKNIGLTKCLTFNFVLNSLFIIVCNCSKQPLKPLEPQTVGKAPLNHWLS